MEGDARSYRGRDSATASAWFNAKLALMLLLVMADIALNSSVEYDDIQRGGDGPANTTALVLVLGFQLAVQVAIPLSVFIMMFETYPFRVGLMGLLVAQYRRVYAVNAVYVVLTAAVYAFRVGKMTENDGMRPSAMWDMGTYTAFSILQKLVACVYYVANVRAAVDLGDPRFYDKRAWVLGMEAEP
ncbi:unnamed protein product [Phaeothamnion confervicola]